MPSGFGTPPVVVNDFSQTRALNKARVVHISVPLLWFPIRCAVSTATFRLVNFSDGNWTTGRAQLEGVSTRETRK